MGSSPWLASHAVLGHHLVDGHRGLHVGRDGTSLRRQRHVLRGDERHRSGVDRIARGGRESHRDDGPLLERIRSVGVRRHLHAGDRHPADRHMVDLRHRKHHELGLFRLHRSREGRHFACSRVEDGRDGPVAAWDERAYPLGGVKRKDRPVDRIPHVCLAVLLLERETELHVRVFDRRRPA